MRALYDFSLVSLETNQSKVVAIVKKPRVFTTLQPTWGFQKFMKKSELEGRPFLLRNHLVLECRVTVIMGTHVSESSRTLWNIQVPPSDLVDNLGKLLELEEGADVTFMVEDKVFHAHKIVLAMRSPVFKAELYGPMRDMNQPSINSPRYAACCFQGLATFYL